MTTTEAKQFRLNDEGQILYQQDVTNPLPGHPVASVKKGAALLQPEIAIQEGLLPEGEARDTVLAGLREWLESHIKTVLEPLVALEATEGEGVDDSVRGISMKLHESLGIRLRSDMEQLIVALTPEGRRALRQRRVRLGPVLVFIPDLNKPAAVRLRALLWNLWHDKPLPAAIPPNGMTSFKVDSSNGGADPDFYRAIGYPVYGPRAIRVDMLDRLISAVYDNAKDGQFQAKHQMSEWLGCPIADLYAVLEAMGHVKTHDPADAQKAVEAEAKTADSKPENAIEAALALLAVAPPAEAEAAPPQADLFAIVPAPETEAAPAPVEAKPVHVRPELATFRLRKGRAYGGQPRPARADNQPDRSARKPYQGNKDKAGQHKRDDKPSFRPRDKKGKPDRHEREDRVIAAAAAPPPRAEDSPFAALKRLKMNAKE